ncbi:MAG: putative viral replication protein [Tantalovirus resnatis]|uniref:Putative viral replication protein n=1 Tax=Circoviridae sp. TaxID=1954248 RepID=A0A385E3U7_9VIRU|nr:MAG: putative viral replication protein [Circoviridae sp.]
MQTYPFSWAGSIRPFTLTPASPRPLNASRCILSCIPCCHSCEACCCTSKPWCYSVTGCNVRYYVTSCACCQHCFCVSPSAHYYLKATSVMSPPQSRRWVFTFNNPSSDDKSRVADFLNDADVCVYAVVGREFAPTTGTPHLQGFAIFGQNRTRPWVLSRLGPCHVEPALGTSKQASTYCKKEKDFDEYGVFPDQPGKRTDLDLMLQWLDDFILDNKRAPSDREIAASQPKAMLRYKNFGELGRLRAPDITLREGDPRDWQTSLEDELKLDADDRSVIFYVDPVGNTGKTWFQQYFCSRYPEECQILGVGKRDDVAHMVDPNKKVYLFNVPRGGMEYFQYTIVEQLKDRMVVSPKYNSCLKILTYTPHVVVFCNEGPDETKMSSDRFLIRNV